MRWIRRIVKDIRAVRSAAGRLGRVEAAERRALAAAIDREPTEARCPSGGWSRLLRLGSGRMREDEARCGAAHLPAVRAAVSGKRALLVLNRAAPELVARLRVELGIECDAEAAVGSPRRRRHLLERIRRGRYDLVLVAQGFAGHGDTQTIKSACREGGAINVLVGKGRLGQIVNTLHRRLVDGEIAGDPMRRE